MRICAAMGLVYCIKSGKYDGNRRYMLIRPPSLQTTLWLVWSLGSWSGRRWPPSQKVRNSALSEPKKLMVNNSRRFGMKLKLELFKCPNNRNLYISCWTRSKYHYDYHLTAIFVKLLCKYDTFLYFLPHSVTRKINTTHTCISMSKECWAMISGHWHEYPLNDGHMCS